MNKTIDQTKRIEDYLHLYIGSDVFIFLDEVLKDGWLKKQLEIQPNLQYSIRIQPGSLGHIISNGYKPILRRLSSMTEEESRFMGGTFHIDGSILDHVDKFTFMLSRSFDLFGLIDSGLAIDINELK